MYRLQDSLGNIKAAPEEDRSSTKLEGFVQDPANRSASLACHKDRNKNRCKFYKGRKVGDKLEICKQGIFLNETSKKDLGVSVDVFPSCPGVKIALNLFKIPSFPCSTYQ
jgi:hypothetical protein